MLAAWSCALAAPGNPCPESLSWEAGYLSLANGFLGASPIECCLDNQSHCNDSSSPELSERSIFSCWSSHYSNTIGGDCLGRITGSSFSLLFQGRTMLWKATQYFVLPKSNNEATFSSLGQWVPPPRPAAYESSFFVWWWRLRTNLCIFIGDWSLRLHHSSFCLWCDERQPCS